MEYQIKSGTLSELEDKVAAAIAEGWKPQGGVCCWGEITNEDDIKFGYSLFAQAMVRDKRNGHPNDQ